MVIWWKIITNEASQTVSDVKKYVGSDSKPAYKLESQFDNDKRIRHFHFYRIFFHLKSGYLQSSNFVRVEIMKQCYFIVFPLRSLCLFSFADGLHSIFHGTVLSLTRLQQITTFRYIHWRNHKQTAEKLFFFWMK